MKIGATILLFILLSESFFYYSYFSISLVKIKWLASEKIAGLKTELINDPGIVLQPVSRLDRDEGDEVWYQGELYDVIKRQEIRGIPYVYLLDDGEESNLITSNYNFFKTPSSDSSKASLVKANSLKCSHGMVDLQYLFPARRKSFISELPGLTYLQSSTPSFTLYSRQVPVPPPKTIPIS